MRIVVVGGGVVGSAVAFFAARKGAQVRLVDAGEGTASQVPAALINPVRGQNGKVNAQALAGMALTWTLVDELVQAGHVIAHGRTGVLRPVPDAATRAKWSAQLPEALPHRWLDPEEVPQLAPGWRAVLELPGAGWLDGAAFLRALQDASGAQVVRGWAAVEGASQVRLASGEALTGDRVVWCGGSIGASARGLMAQHRGGSLLLMDRALSARSISFGVYASPAAVGGVLGATFEAPTPAFNDQPPPASSLAWLGAGARRLLGTELPSKHGRWTGSRLSTSFTGPQSDGSWALAGLGSKGFLLGPLLARSLVENEAFWSGPS